MRREKTLKIVANHLVIDDGKGTFNLKEHPSSDKSWTYCAQDFSDGEAAQTTFAIRFANADGAQAVSSCIAPPPYAQLRVSTSAAANTFKAKFEECQEENSSKGVRLPPYATHLPHAILQV